MVLELIQNLKKELEALLHEKADISVLLLGACSLHPVHTTFKNGISEVDLLCETFFNDLGFFKLSAARLEDYVGVGVAIGIAAEFAKKSGAMRWLCMKQVWILCIWEKYAYDGNTLWYCFQYTCFL